MTTESSKEKLAVLMVRENDLVEKLKYFNEKLIATRLEINKLLKKIHG